MRSDVACGVSLVEQHKKCSQAQHFGVFVMSLFTGTIVWCVCYVTVPGNFQHTSATS